MTIDHTTVFGARNLTLTLPLSRRWKLGSDLGPLLVERARERGLLLNSPRTGVLRFMPALNVGDAEIDTMVERLDSLLEEQRVR
jgi:acetylornithine/N-succinyldiaminopimelate aminotransferase